MPKKSIILPICSYRWILYNPIRLWETMSPLDVFIPPGLKIIQFWDQTEVWFLCFLCIQVAWKSVFVYFLFCYIQFSCHILTQNSLKFMIQSNFFKTLITPCVLFPNTVAPEWKRKKNSFGCKVTQSFYPKLSNPLHQPQPINSARLSPCRNDERHKRHSWFFHQYLSSAY